MALSNFNSFLLKFPELKLPIVLDEESVHTFSLENQPLTERLTQEFIIPYEIEEADDMTEFIACCRIAGIKDFHALVYWRAGLMTYQYILATFDKSGKRIDQKTLAGTYSDGKIVTNSVAKIDEDWTIYIVSGQTDDEHDLYDASKSKTVELELLPDGRIVDSLE